jgi:mycothiol synthase
VPTPFPPLPDGLTARPMQLSDADAVAVLLAAAETVDRTAENYSGADLVEWWDTDFVDPAEDGRVVHTTDGTLVGYATTIASPTFRDAFGVQLEGRVHPDRRGRGIGRALLAWQLDQGARLHAARHPEAPARLSVGVAATMPSLEALLRRAGLRPHRWFSQMERPLTDLPRPHSLAGVELVPFGWDRDDEVRRAHNAAFTDHYGSSERDTASWEALFTGQRAFRPDLSVLALEDGAVVGYALVYVYAADTAVRGYPAAYFGQIGVLPHARGRGLAPAVITESLRRAAAAGCRMAELDVDSDNVTGARGIYERLGFTTAQTQVTWVRELDRVQ